MRLLVSVFPFLFLSLFAQEKNIKSDYLNPDLPLNQRVNNLVSQMTLEEKISQIINSAKAIPRLNIPEYNWWNECLHGVARAGNATVFPQAIALAATWNSDLMLNIADVISTEARAKYNEFIRNGDHEIFKGLTFWSPNINIFRDPRWGRGQETYGEDPYLTSRMGVSFVKGLQGNDPKYFKVISTPKHYAVHSGPEPLRHTFNAVVNSYDLFDTYLPAFESCVKEAGAFSVMCAYNRFMGDACCGSNLLLHKILREKWGFKGYIVSDCGAIDDIFKNHKVVETAPEAAAVAIKSGTDLECGRVYESAVIEAVKKGLLTEKDIDTAVERLFTARFKLGMFDPSDMVKYNKIPIEENDSPEHHQLALRAARESIVLLKNSNNTLPLKTDLKKIAVIGPTADSYYMLLGNYNGTPSKYVTPLQGIKNKLENKTSKTEIIYDPGCNLVEKGNVMNSLTSDIVNADGKPGLKAEYYKNTSLEGEPFFTKVDPLDNPNWIYGTRSPNIRNEPKYSIRWTGIFTAHTAGDYDFTVKGDHGYRLYINDKVLLEDWTEHEAATTKSGIIHFEAEKTYNIKIEYTRSKGVRRPQLSVQWANLSIDYFEKAVDMAKSSDVVIFIGGITAQLEGEEMEVDYEGFKGGDRTDLKIPAVQEELLKAIYTTGKPVVLVLTSGSALAANWENENIPAIVQLWYPGQEGGTALADVLFGEYNPAGRLPVTFYKSADQLPPFEDYDMKGRTYRYFEGDPLYSFGYGLSYTTFKYSNLVVPVEVEAGDEVKVTAEVQNTGKIPGDEVVQLYIKDVNVSVPVPLHSLQGFKRIHLDPGEKQVVEFKLQPKQLAIIKTNDSKEVPDVTYIVQPGSFEISVGGIQPGFKAPTTETLTMKMKVKGELIIPD